MKKLLGKFFSSNFCKFIFIGFINTVFGSAIMFLFYNMLHFNYWVSSASNYVLGSFLSYVLNRKYTFQNRERITKTLPRFIIHICLCYLIAYGIAKSLIFFALPDYSTEVKENIAMVAGMCLFVVLNYIGQTCIVFKTR